MGPILKKVFYLFVIIFFLNNANSNAQNLEISKRNLQILLDERDSLFAEYEESLNRRSQLFLFRSKQDEAQSSVVLHNIIKLDNRIMLHLKSLQDIESFEKRKQSESLSEEQNRVLNYEKVIDNQRRAITLLDSEKRSLISLKRKLWFVIACLIIIIFLFFRYNLRAKIKRK